MISRREFLFNTAAGLFIAASPKIIVDMGANLWRKRPIELGMMSWGNFNSDAEVWYIYDKLAKEKGRPIPAASVSITGREWAMNPGLINQLFNQRIGEAVSLLLNQENAYLVGEIPKIELSTTPRPLIEGQNANKSFTFNGL